MIQKLMEDIHLILSTPHLLYANIISLIAALCMIVSCVVSRRKYVFLLQAAQCGLLCFTQLILGMYGGLVTLLLGATRNALTAFDKMTARRTLYFAIAIGVAGSAVNFLSEGGMIGLLPVAATVLYTFGCHYIRHPNIMRLNIFVNTVLWIGYSLAVLDYVTALTDMTTAVVDGVVMVWVFFKKKVLK